MKARLFAVSCAAMLILGMLPSMVAARQPTEVDRTLPSSIEDLKLDKPETRNDLKGKIHTSLADVRGPQRVMVRLTRAPSVAVAAQGEAAQVAQLGRVRAQQQVVIAVARKLDGRSRVLGRTARATNVVAMRIDASKLDALAKDPNVVSIKPVIDYEMALSETVPYIGATAVQDRGYTGKGVRVAVLDSGIDYTHVAMGGAGTLAAYEAAYGTTQADSRNRTLDGLFPTAKVKGGYDFVGESWPDGDGIEDPDPDPIDFDGHGTHVADIIGGTNGVAPDVTLYALKVCSSVTPACSGVALIQAMDWAIDPNGDGKTRDHVDVINMSLGSDYGSVYDDDLSLAVDRASKIGVLTVAAAGNGGDKPWIAGTPASAKTALSVAQTQVPSARAFPLVVNTPPAIAGTYTNTETVDWAPLGSGFAGDVAFIGRGCPAGSIDGTNPADPFLANPAGKVALIDRGGCSVSLKVDRAAKAGATAVLIGLVAPGDAVSFSFGGGDTFVPTMIIQQSLSNAIKAQLAGGATVNVSVSDAVSIPLVGSVVGSSSRGPSTIANTIKPEIGAPGASVSAVAGSGTGTQAFGGTSGATPMVAGAAALIIDAFPSRSVSQVKSLLMNTAETDVFNNAANTPGYLAPITRIGGGEVRVDRAVKSPSSASERTTGSGAVSFGLIDVTDKTVVLRRTVDVRNFSSKTRNYKVSSTFRFEDDKLNKAIKISVPSSIRVPRNGRASFTVRMTIDGRKLREWTLDSGVNALNARLLDTLEYDGYLWLNDTSTSSDNADPLHLAWHVLPRLSGEIHAPGSAKVDSTIADGVFAGLPAAHVRLRNEGVGPGYVDSYSLVGTSPNLPPSKRGSNAPVIDLRAIGVQTFPVPADFCSADPSFIYVFAINTWERTGTIGAFPGEFDIFLDTDRDGTDDYVVFNAPLNSTLDARELTWSVNLDDPAGIADAFFFADSGTNDANKVMAICGEQIGMNQSNFFDVMHMDVGAFDNYFTGALTDSIVGMKVAPLGERYLGVFDANGTVSGDIPPFSRAVMDVVDFGPDGTNPTETGIMLVANASRPSGVRGGAPPKREALLIRIAH